MENSFGNGKCSMDSSPRVTWFEMNQAGLASSSLYLILFSAKICVLVYVLVWGCMWRSEGSMQELLPMCPGDQTQVIRLSGEAYLLTYLLTQPSFFGVW